MSLVRSTIPNEVDWTDDVTCLSLPRDEAAAADLGLIDDMAVWVTVSGACASYWLPDGHCV